MNNCIHSIRNNQTYSIITCYFLEVYNQKYQKIMAQIQATDYNQIQNFLNTNKVAVIDFYADWCGPCKAIAPYVTQKCQQQGIGLIKVNVDQAPQLSQAYGVSSMPTFVTVAGNWNGVIQRQSGGSQQVVDYMIQCAKPYKK